MPGRARSQWPAVLPLAFVDRKVVDARDAPPHQAALVEFPVLVAVRAEPAPGCVVPFVGEAHRNAVAVAGPQFLDQAIVELARPLALKESDDLAAASQELVAVAPYAVRRVGERDAQRLAAVPGVLGQPHFLR